MCVCGLPAALAQQDSQPAPRHAPFYRDHARLTVVRDGLGHERPIRTLADWNVRRDHTLAHFHEVAGTLPGESAESPLISN